MEMALPARPRKCTALLEAAPSVGGVGRRGDGGAASASSLSEVEAVDTHLEEVADGEMALPARSSCWQHGRRPIRSMCAENLPAGGRFQRTVRSTRETPQKKCPGQ